MNKSLNTEALIWKRILETTDIYELEALLNLVISDQESIDIILDKVSTYKDKNKVEINLTINS